MRMRLATILLGTRAGPDNVNRHLLQLVPQIDLILSSVKLELPPTYNCIVVCDMTIRAALGKMQGENDTYGNNNSSVVIQFSAKINPNIS